MCDLLKLKDLISNWRIVTIVTMDTIVEIILYYTKCMEVICSLNTTNNSEFFKGLK